MLVTYGGLIQHGRTITVPLVTDETRWVSSALEQLREIARVFLQRLNSIRNDVDLSPAGRLKKLKSLGPETLTEIRLKIGETAELRRLERRRGEVQNTLASRLDTLAAERREDIGHRLDVAEVRRHLAEMKRGGTTHIAFMAVLDQAMRAGDIVTLDALLNAPILLQVLAPETVEQGRADWRDRILSERWPVLRDEADGLETASDAIESCLRAVEVGVRHETGLPETLDARIDASRTQATAAAEAAKIKAELRRSADEEREERLQASEDLKAELQEAEA